jgi:signal transduction histidine kinase
MENLIGNALKYTPEDGRVVIRAGLTNGDGRYWIEVSVSDTGCGISLENQEKIFDKFKRIDNGKATVRGTGLGLSICRHIISAHGGKIWAQSEPGKGSTFYISLPVELP